MSFHRRGSIADQTMMISRSIRFAVVISNALAAVLLLGCTPIVRPAAVIGTQEGTDAILPNSKVTWKGEGCRTILSSSALLSITGPTSEDKSCVSSLFPISPGHIAITATLGRKFPTKEIDVGVRLRIFDKLHNEISLKGNFLSREVDADYFRGATFSGDDPTTSILFAPPTYPLDGGWIPTSAKFAQIELHSGTPLEINAMSVSRSKWNLTLIERLSGTKQSPLPDSPWQPIAVNIQGTADAQRAEILEAHANWKPRGPTLLIAQLDPRDLEHDRLSVDAIALLESLQAWSAEDSNIRFGVSVNPYLNGVFRKESVQFRNEIASRATANIILPFVMAGASLILLRTDDFAPTSGKGRFDFVLSSRADKRAYHSLADAHAAFIQSVYRAVSSVAPSTVVAFVPPWYASSFIEHQPEHARDYLTHLAQNTPSAVPFVWTGPGVRSLLIDDASSAAFQGALGTHPIMIWDNTPYARAHRDFWLKRPMRIPLCSMIEPYDVPISQNFHKQQKVRPWLLINTGVNPLQRIQLETAQAYLTLNERYNPESALKAILEEDFGKAGAALILQIDRLFWLRHSQRELVGTAEPDSGESGNNAFVREAEIQKALTALSEELDGKAAGLQAYLASLAASR